MTSQGAYILDNGRFDPTLSPRIAAGWTRILRLLEDGTWRDWSAIVTTVTAETDLTAKTISNLLHSGVTSGYFARQGDYKAGTRQVRQVRWP